MSSSTSSTKPSVAIIGGTGQLGEPITSVFLTDYKASFSTVRVFTRDPSATKAQDLAKKGAEVVALDLNSLATALAGTDVVVNLLASSVSEEDRNKVGEAAVKAGVKVFFLGEFGLDHRLVDFSGYEHPEWAEKQEIAKATRAIAKGTQTKVIALYSSIFVEILLGPYLGFDLQNNVFTPYGPASQKFATTSKADIGRATASLSLLALDPKTAASVPDLVRIAGSIVTFEDVRDIFARVKGVPKGEIQSVDIEAAIARLRSEKGHAGNLLDYIRVALGKNWADFSENDNELVNPGQKAWKWKTLEDQIRSL
ncbi:NmrA-like family-domain-containing protein [Lenzites betulinus]|nr:NmrA-like family-domain-containing protein [Lenzites betulinus]